MTTYQATPRAWADVDGMSGPGSPENQCLLELRARVEALETAAHKHIVETSANILALASRVEALEAKYETQRLATLEWGKDVDKVMRWSDQHLQRIMALEANSKPTPNSSQIRSSLVDRVALAISGIEYGLERDEEAVNWDPEARAAIREVAAWMRENECGYNAVRWLEQEAER